MYSDRAKSRKPIQPRKRAGRVSPADYQRLAAFRDALREFMHFSEQAAGAAGVSPQQHQAMLVIRGCAGPELMTVGELAAHLRIKHQSAVGLVDRMRRGGLLIKSYDRADARQVRLRLSAVGERQLRELTAAHKMELGRIGPVLRKLLENVAPAP